MIKQFWVVFFLAATLFSDVWIDQLLEEEFRPFQKGITREALEATWARCRREGSLFRRFQVIDGKVYGPDSQTKNLLVAIVERYPLPDVDFIHHNHDILLDSWFGAGHNYAPIFASAKLVGGERTLLFMDWYYDICSKDSGSLNGLIEMCDQETGNFPWEARRSQAIWRGASNDGYYTPKNWKQIPRGALVEFSQRNPLLVDAGFSNYHTWTVSDMSFFLNRVGTKPFVSPFDQLRYKYQIDLDGTTPTYPSLHWKMFTGSLIFKQYPSPKGILWYTCALIPWEHFIPIKPDVSDLAEKLQWAITHDEEAKRIAENGRNFAMTHLRQEHILLYCYKALERYASLQQFQPSLEPPKKPHRKH